MPPKTTTTTTTTTAQSTTATALVRSGLSLQLLGLAWGIAIASTPFPRLALSAHLGFMTQGAMVVVAGLLLQLQQPRLVRLGAWQCRIVYWGLGGLWVSLLADCVNAFWGTNQLASLAAAQAGAKGGSWWQELIMTQTHVGPAMALIVVFVVLITGTFGVNDEGKLKD